MKVSFGIRCLSFRISLTLFICIAQISTKSFQVRNSMFWMSVSILSSNLLNSLIDARAFVVLSPNVSLVEDSAGFKKWKAFHRMRINISIYIYICIQR